MNLRLSVAALVVLGAIALSVAAAPASATVFCKVASSSSCGAESRLGAGTKVESHLKTGTRSLINNAAGEALYECRESTFDMTTTAEGGSSSTVTASTAALSFGTCEGTTPIVLNKPSLVFHWIPESSNATVTEQGIEITIVYLLSLDCVYGAFGEQRLGTLIGGKPAEIWMNLTLARIKGNGCPESLTWAGTYEVTAPDSLYVTSG